MPKVKPKLESLTPDPDSPLRAYLGYNIKMAYLAVHSDLSKVLSEKGLRIATFSALLTIVDAPDISQSQLAQKLGIDRSGVVLLVDELERADLIGRNKVPGDRRAYALRATVKGIKVAKEAADAVGAREERLFAALSAEERAVMTDFLKRIEIAGGAIGDDN